MTKNIFNWNHISSNLTQDQMTELKEYYQTYHRKCWAFKQAAKRFKKWKLLGDTSSVIFATGGIASAIATSGISLVAISTTSVIIQGWMKHKNLELKIQNCTHAYQSYQHLMGGRYHQKYMNFKRFRQEIDDSSVHYKIIIIIIIILLFI